MVVSYRSYMYACQSCKPIIIQIWYSCNAIYVNNHSYTDKYISYTAIFLFLPVASLSCSCFHIAYILNFSVVLPLVLFAFLP